MSLFNICSCNGPLESQRNPACVFHGKKVLESVFNPDDVDDEAEGVDYLEIDPTNEPGFYGED